MIAQNNAERVQTAKGHIADLAREQQEHKESQRRINADTDLKISMLQNTINAQAQDKERLQASLNDQDGKLTAMKQKNEINYKHIAELQAKVRQQGAEIQRLVKKANKKQKILGII